MRFMIIVLCISALIMACDTQSVTPTENPNPEQPAVENPTIEAPKVETPTIENPKVDSSMVKPVIPTTPMPGSYTKQDPDSAEIQEFANKVVALLQKDEADLTLVKVHEAATQVVAGLNYFLRMEFKTKSSSNELRDIIVYKDLQQNISITKMEVVK